MWEQPRGLWQIPWRSREGPLEKLLRLDQHLPMLPNPYSHKTCHFREQLSLKTGCFLSVETGTLTMKSFCSIQPWYFFSAISYAFMAFTLMRFGCCSSRSPSEMLCSNTSMNFRPL